MSITNIKDNIALFCSLVKDYEFNQNKSTKSVVKNMMKQNITDDDVKIIQDLVNRLAGYQIKYTYSTYLALKLYNPNIEYNVEYSIADDISFRYNFLNNKETYEVLRSGKEKLPDQISPLDLVTWKSISNYKLYIIKNNDLTKILSDTENNIIEHCDIIRNLRNIRDLLFFYKLVNRDRSNLFSIYMNYCLILQIVVASFKRIFNISDLHLPWCDYQLLIDLKNYIYENRFTINDPLMRNTAVAIINKLSKYKHEVIFENPKNTDNIAIRLDKIGGATEGNTVVTIQNILNDSLTSNGKPICFNCLVLKQLEIPIGIYYPLSDLEEQNLKLLCSKIISTQKDIEYFYCQPDNYKHMFDTKRFMAYKSNNNEKIIDNQIKDLEKKKLPNFDTLATIWSIAIREPTMEHVELVFNGSKIKVNLGNLDSVLDGITEPLMYNELYYGLNYIDFNPDNIKGLFNKYTDLQYGSKVYFFGMSGFLKSKVTKVEPLNNKKAILNNVVFDIVKSNSFIFLEKDDILFIPVTESNLILFKNMDGQICYISTKTYDLVEHKILTKMTDQNFNNIIKGQQFKTGGSSPNIDPVTDDVWEKIAPLNTVTELNGGFSAKRVTYDLDISSICS